MVEIVHQFNDATLKKLVKIIDNGGVVAFPTETVYALAADAANYEAVARIYSLKRRFNEKPLPILVGDVMQAQRIAEFDERAKKLALHFFPGPITLVLKVKPKHNLASNINKDLDSIGIRMPSNSIALRILKAVGRPLVGTSANISNQISAIRAEEVVASFGNQIEMIIDGGPAEIGTSSTIVDLTAKEAKILREGIINNSRIEKLIKGI